jgi:hypothetical protein
LQTAGDRRVGECRANEARRIGSVDRREENFPKVVTKMLNGTGQ